MLLLLITSGYTAVAARCAARGAPQRRRSADEPNGLCVAVRVRCLVRIALASVSGPRLLLRGRNMSEEDAVEEGEPEEYEYEDEWEEQGFTPSGSLDAPAFKSWREQADNARAQREEQIMAAAAQAAPHLRKKMSAEELMASAERQHAKRGERDKKLKEKQEQLDRQTGSLHSDKKAVWDGEGGLVSRLYKPSPQSRRTDNHQGHVDFSAALRGGSPAGASPSPRTPRTLAVKPGSTKKKQSGGGGTAAAAPQLPPEGAQARELVMAKAERDRLKKRLEEVTAELELAKSETERADAAKEALLEAQAELQVSRQEEERLAAAAKAMEQRLQSVLAAAAAQGVDLSAIDGLGGSATAGDETSPGSSEEDDADGVTTMEIQCPEGVGPGDTIALETPDGDQIELQIPEGIAPGDVFAVQIS